MKKICAAMLSLSGLLAIAAYADKPKGYSVNLPDAKIGSVDVERGQYSLLVHMDEKKVQLKDQDGKVVDVPASVETVDAKFDRTEVQTENVNGVNRVKEIRIGGAKIRIAFPAAS